MIKFNYEIQPVIDKTIHHAVNFHPEDYEVLDYLDNKPPQFCFPGYGLSQAALDAAMAQFRLMREQWNQTMTAYFPHRGEGCNIHQCTHCGNGNVRYIVAVRHIPTNQHVVFGSDCVARLGFKNQSAFKVAQVKARAEAGNARMAAYLARVKFLEARPEFKAALESLDLNGPLHRKNGFLRDLVHKFNQYGNLSERQIECFFSSIARDKEFAARKAAEAAEVRGVLPSGRADFVGVIVSHREQESDFGVVTKILVKLETNCKIWMTCPSAIVPKVGDRYKFRATVEASKDDPNFGFGKRPSVVANYQPVEGGVL
jgi:hypothetical protein